MVKFVIIAVVVTLIGIIGFSLVESVTGQIVSGGSTTSTSENGDTLKVSITGEVRKTGTYSLPNGSTLLTLIEAANGATTNADPKAYNTDYILRSSQTFYIAPIYDNSNTCSTSPIEKVNINNADKTTLMKVSAFSSTIASAIIDYRENTSSFGCIEELKNVTGIGNAIFGKAKDYVTLMD